MGYIGNQTSNSYSSMDKQTITGDGTPNYTLTHAVANAQEIEVFVNNVRQEPGVAYTVSGTALTMTGNVASSDSFYVIYQGKALQSVVPPDDSVTKAMMGTTELDLATIKDSTGNTTAMTINSSGLVIPKSVAFQVEATDTDQSYTASAYAKITWETVTLDTGSYWDTTNNRYTPQVAGWYLFGGTVRVNVSSLVNFVAFNVAKNGQTDDGTPLMSQIQNSSADTFGNGEYAMPTGMIQLNGSTDYVEAYFQCDENTTLHDHATRKSYFWGKLVHAT